jgi:DNA-binding transcriptional regulator/RsmH inhibitor MraZ
LGGWDERTPIGRKDAAFKRLPVRVEIWDKERWEEKDKAALGELSGLAKELGIQA